MSKINILDTTIGKGVDLKSHIADTLKFLISNKSSIVLPNVEREKLIKSANTPMRTVISDLFSSLLEDEKLGIFQFLNLSHIEKIPASFLITWLDLDVRQMSKYDRHFYDVLSVIPEYKDKILLDITPFISRDGSRLVDISTFQAKIVRDALCRSYSLSESEWLSPTLIYYFAKFYSIVISNRLGRIYNLTYQEQMVIAAVLSVYFINKCSPVEMPDNSMMRRLDYVNRIVDTTDIMDTVQRKVSEAGKFTIKEVVDVIVELSPTRLGKFNVHSLFSTMLNLSSNQLISIISLEYPPFWCFNVLDAMSGAKTSLYHTIKTSGLGKETGKLATELVNSKTFSRSIS